MRSRWKLWTTGTWFIGFQTSRTYVTPWVYQTDIFLIPGVAIRFYWQWHCADCREEAKA